MSELRNFFFPTEQNSNLPRALSNSVFLGYLLLASLALLGPAYLNYAQLASLVAPLTYGNQEVITLVNAARREAGLGTLRPNEALAQAAADKAQDMVQKKYFAHISPENKSPWDFLREADYTYVAAGENLAIDFPTADQAQKALMASPTHRANILNKLYTEVGVAVVQGNIEGHPDILVVQYFGRPRPAFASGRGGSSSGGQAAARKPTPVPVLVGKTETRTESEVPKAAPTPPPQVTVAPATGTVAILGRSTAPAVLGVGGAEMAANPESKISADRLVELISSFQVVSVLISLLVLLAIGFLLARTGRLPFAVLAKTVFLFLLLGYFALGSTRLPYSPQTSPAAFATTIAGVLK
ncbi:MAG: hypothetical protein HY978_04965 [Candidatus Liptonbacteria bacterium]|nr:hypothetical protein [Candidatus Liptonbacteria bacterium]